MLLIKSVNQSEESSYQTAVKSKPWKTNLSTIYSVLDCDLGVLANIITP